MDFRAKMNKGVNKVFQKLDTGTVLMSYRQTKLGAYDPTSNNTSDTIKKTDVKMFLSVIQDGQYTLADYTAGDMMGTFLDTSVTFLPVANDLVYRYNTKETYTVVNVERNGLDLIYKVQLRKQ